MRDWQKLGLVFVPPGCGNMQSHAMLPTPLVLDDCIRVYFASCDSNLRGRIYWVELGLNDPSQVLRVSKEPALDIGDPGAFDADGVNPSHIIAREGVIYLYYVGWRRGTVDAPYTLLTGLAVSNDGGRQFRRYSTDPILPPETGETLFRTAAHVFPYRRGWGMIYVAGDQFFSSETGKRLPIYGVRLTTSFDGLLWSGPGEAVLEPDRALGEIGFGRPVIWHNKGELVLLLAVRTEAGYSMVSIGECLGDRRGWTEVLERSPSGWDSEMTCFGAPCSALGQEYLFYNGNGFGRTGFGLAKRPAEATPRKSLDGLGHALSLFRRPA